MSQEHSDVPPFKLPKRGGRLSRYIHGTIERRQQGCDCDMCLQAERSHNARIAAFKRLNPPSKGKRRGRR